MEGEITQLLSFSAGRAAGWLMFYRVAYGLGGDSADALTLSDAAALIRGIVEADKIALDLAEGDAALGRGATKALLNAALVGLETLPNRGHLTLAVENGDGLRIRVVAEGDGVAMRPEVRAALTPGAAVGDLTARTVQGWFTAWLAHSLGGALEIAADQPARVAVTVALPDGRG
jgi:histidine phosphotransferase ChpT